MKTKLTAFQKQLISQIEGEFTKINSEVVDTDPITAMILSAHKEASSAEREAKAIDEFNKKFIANFLKEMLPHLEVFKRFGFEIRAGSESVYIEVPYFHKDYGRNFTNSIRIEYRTKMEYLMVNGNKTNFTYHTPEYLRVTGHDKRSVYESEMIFEPSNIKGIVKLIADTYAGWVKQNPDIYKEFFKA